MRIKFCEFTVRILCLVLLLSATLYAQNPLATPNKIETTQLEQNQTVEREISDAQKHFYRIRLQANQFVKIELSSADCSLALTIYALDDNTWVENKYDSPNKIVTGVAAVSEAGNYLVRIKPNNKIKNLGKYLLKVSELHSANDKELSYTQGRKILFELETSVKSDSSTANLRLAIKRYEEAIEKFRIAETPKYEGVALDNIGIIYSKLGEKTKSIEFSKKAIEKFRSIGDNYSISRSLNSIGRVYSELGDRQKALETFAETLLIAREAKSQLSEALALNGIGSVYNRLKEPIRAKNYHYEALKIFAEIGEVHNQVVTLNYLGNAASSEKNYQEAIEFYQKAIELEKTMQGRDKDSSYLNNLGLAYVNLGETDKGLEYISQALKICRTKSDKLSEAFYLQQLGRIQFQQNKLPEALESLSNSLEIYRAVEEPTRLADTLFLLAKVVSRHGQLEQAQKYLEEGLKLIESFRADLKTSEFRESFAVTLYDYYSFYIELLMKRHQSEPTKNFAEIAWQASERARARNLLNLIDEAKVDIRQGVDLQLLERERRLADLLDSRLQNLTRVLSKNQKSEEFEKLKLEIAQLRTEHQLAQAKIREKNPHYSALMRPQTLDLKEVQNNLLDANSALLEYKLGDQTSFLWVVTKDSLQVFELPARAEIEKSVRLYYESITARNKRVKFETAEEQNERIIQAELEAPKLADQLSQMIVAPAAGLLSNKHLLIVADGALQYVSFASLSAQSSAPKSEKQFLVESNEIVMLPSASVLGLMRREFANRPLAPKTVAVLADPVFDSEDERFKTVWAKNKLAPKIETVSLIKKKRPTPPADLIRAAREVGLNDDDLSLPRLPYTRREAESISSFAPAAERRELLDFSASRASALSSELANYQFVHFATHSLFNDQNPELSGIILSLVDEQGAEQNGFLRQTDVYNLKLPAELIVLSGCRTGLGKEIKGEGIVGLTRGFMYAGARRVAVSLWDVNDEATAELMSRFYHGMLGKERLSPAAALRGAQISLLKSERWQNPYYWAAFTLQGEPR